MTTRINLSLPEDSTSYPDHRTATSLHCWAFGTGFGLWKVGSSAKRTTMICIILVSFDMCYCCLCFYTCIAVLYLDTIYIHIQIHSMQNPHTVRYISQNSVYVLLNSGASSFRTRNPRICQIGPATQISNEGSEFWFWKTRRFSVVPKNKHHTWLKLMYVDVFLDPKTFEKIFCNYETWRGTSHALSLRLLQRTSRTAAFKYMAISMQFTTTDSKMDAFNSFSSHSCSIHVDEMSCVLNHFLAFFTVRFQPIPPVELALSHFVISWRAWLRWLRTARTLITKRQS